MKIAYIILAHNKVNHLQRLVQRLIFENCAFFIHIDKKVEIAPFTSALKSCKNVQFVKNRMNGKWGGIGIVRATISALQEIENHPDTFDRIILLSGQDYPIKSNSEIFQFFSDNKTIDFIEYTPFPVKELNFGGMHRIHHRSYNIKGERHTYLPKSHSGNLNSKGKIINQLLGFIHLILPKRKVPYGLLPYYGSQWWNITGKTGSQILDYLDKHPLYLNYHSKSLLPDEMFFQTLVLYFEQKETLMNDNKRFIVWEKGTSHPQLLSVENIPEIKKSAALFARKFDENAPVLNLIDKLVSS